MRAALVPDFGNSGFRSGDFATLVPDFGSSSVRTAGSQLQLMRSGRPYHVWNIEIQPLPAASPVPGATVVDATAGLRDLMDTMPTIAAAWALEFGATDGDEAVFDGLVATALEDLGPALDDFEAIFLNLDPETQALYEQLALANGLDDAFAELERGNAAADRLMLSMMEISTDNGSRLVDLICAANAVVNVSAQIARINETVSRYLTILSYVGYVLPPVRLLTAALSRVSTLISIVTGAIEVVAPYVPRLDRNVSVGASATQLVVGDSATLTMQVTVISLTTLCAQAGSAVVGTLVDRMKGVLQRGIARLIPGVSTLFARAQWDRDEMSFFVGRAYDGIGAIAGRVVDAVGVETALSNMADRVCAYVSDPVIPVNSDSYDATCGTVVSGVWTCTEACVGETPRSARPSTCAARMRPATRSCSAAGADRPTATPSAATTPASTRPPTGKTAAPAGRCAHPTPRAPTAPASAPAAARSAATCASTPRPSSPTAAAAAPSAP